MFLTDISKFVAALSFWQPAFTHGHRQKLQQKILNEKVQLLLFLTSEAHSLLKRLLQKDPTRRLGSGPSGGDDIKHHIWFRLINWKKLDAREQMPKFNPDQVSIFRGMLPWTLTPGFHQMTEKFPNKEK
ncbi:serine/threonine-protein kinase AtPK2/AtPK19-like [Mangifera indica]|uniref:serine/threonine-protein kinase AtPK2/AtPK19-like n=1 Tax=Mangifera indica TaxID=29780 RepID=UPI001CFAAFD9|nr:serine/threonine-protein kinase AtPK2/AtPK19-like [Mangifera indica]